MTIIDFIKDNWLILTPIVYEIVVRLIPKSWNPSIIDYIMSILNAVIPNKRKPQPEDVVSSTDKEKNLVAVSRTRWVVK